MSKLVLIIDGSWKTLASSISEKFSYLGADLIFWIFVIITHRLECIFQILTTIIPTLPFSHSLEIQREVSKHPVKVRETLGYLVITFIIRLHPDIFADPQYIWHVFECFFIDMPQSTHSHILTSYRWTLMTVKWKVRISSSQRWCPFLDSKCSTDWV